MTDTTVMLPDLPAAVASTGALKPNRAHVRVPLHPGSALYSAEQMHNYAHAAIAALAGQADACGQEAGAPLGYIRKSTVDELAMYDGVGDVVIFRNGFGEDSVAIYTTPPAAIPVVALRELVTEWRKRALRWPREADEIHRCTDSLLKLIAPASIGAEAQEGK